MARAVPCKKSAPGWRAGDTVKMSWTRFTIAALLSLSASIAGAQERARRDTIPKAHYPPAGMCRIWLDGVPAERQPAPTDCVTAVRNRPTNGRVIFGPDARSGSRPRLQPRPSDFRAGSAIGRSCVDRNGDGVCDESWARPTEPRRPIPRTDSQSEVQRRDPPPPAPRTEESTRERPTTEKAAKGKEPGGER